MVQVKFNLMNIVQELFAYIHTTLPEESTIANPSKTFRLYHGYMKYIFEYLKMKFFTETKLTTEKYKTFMTYFNRLHDCINEEIKNLKSTSAIEKNKLLEEIKLKEKQVEELSTKLTIAHNLQKELRENYDIIINNNKTIITAINSNIEKLHNTEKNFNDGLADLQMAYKKQLIKAGEKHAY